MSEEISVLHVDDDPDTAATTAAALEREAGAMSVRTATSIEAGLDRFEAGQFDAVVSDYNLPGGTGLDLLEALRAADPAIPFVLFTATGSEEVASEAISAGVTDYLQKGEGPDQYAVLANRIRNAVAQYRAEGGAPRAERRFRKLIEGSSDVVSLVDANGTFQYVSPAVEDVLGYRPAALVGRNGFELVHPDDRESTMEEFFGGSENPEQQPRTEFRAQHADGSWRTLQVTGRNLLDDPDVEAFVVNARDVTDSARMRRELEAQAGKIEALHAAAAEIIGCRTIDAVYRKTVGAAERILDFEMCATMIHEDGMLRPKAMSSGAPADGARPMEPDEGNAGRVFQTGEPEITVDARSDDVAKPAKESYRSAISVPIGEHGVFQAVATEPGEYTEEDVELAELLLSYTAAVVERIQSEQQLRDERDRFGALFEHTSDCIAVLDFEDGDWLVRRVNPSFVETFGYESEEIVGEPIDEYVTPESELEEAREITRRAEDGVATEREVTRRTVNGDREFLLRSVPYRSGGELRGYAVYTDITERKRAERRFRALIERSNDFITVLDPDGTIRYQSPSLERILGHDPERAVGQNVFETIHPEDRDRVREQFMRSIDDPDRTPIMVYRTRHRDGSWRYIESIGSNHLDDPAIEGYVVNSRDVTDRIRRERILETLHESTRELMAAESKAAIADTASDTASDILGLPINGVHLYDAEEGGLVPVAASEAAREMFEEPPTFHPGEGLAWEVYETGEPQFYPDLRDRGDTYNPETPVRSELLVPLGDHGVFIASSTAPDAFDETDVALAKVLAANVETALDRAERGRQLRARTRELERQNQRLDEFASVVAHDLRNPLNVAAGRLHLARERGEASDFEAIERAHDRMSRIIDDVLALARQGRTVGDTTAVGLDEVARAAWANVESGSATLAVEADLTLDADEGRLRTLFENLFRNAIEHGGDAVAVTIGELDGRSGFYLEDDGPGIPPEASERVFESGYSTTPVGTGFGLAIVSSIAEAHGWTITATEAAAGGARFEISGVADA